MVSKNRFWPATSPSISCVRPLSSETLSLSVEVGAVLP